MRTNPKKMAVPHRPNRMAGVSQPAGFVLSRAHHVFSLMSPQIAPNTAGGKIA